jgi:hypothetical protein
VGSSPTALTKINYLVALNLMRRGTTLAGAHRGHISLSTQTPQRVP